ncbi:lactonase family protein [Terriglobus roseus]|nr:beta-propeller fold lactonase family protein [Terriglobus roseus]
MRIKPSLLLLCLLPISGCNGFFQKDSTTGTTTGTSATNYAFVANTGSNTVTGLGISTTGTLAALSGSPITLGLPPTALVVSRDNKFLWVGTVSAIYGYTIASDGTLAAMSSGNAIANAICTDMQVSPDGKWMMVLDGSGNSIDLFAINTDGTLTPGPNSGIGFTASGTVIPQQLRIAPSGAYVVAAMGTAGELVFSFNTTTGALALLTQTTPPGTTSDNGIAIDSTSTYLYEARSGSNPGLVVSTVGSNGNLTPTTSTTYAAGAQPYSVVLDNTNKYVYVANRTDGTISGYNIGTNAALTAIAGSPFSSGVAVQSLGADSTGKWLLAASYSGSPDLSLYGFDATNLGRLYSVSSAATGTNASVLALSH